MTNNITQGRSIRLFLVDGTPSGLYENQKAHEI